MSSRYDAENEVTRLAASTERWEDVATFVSIIAGVILLVISAVVVQQLWGGAGIVIFIAVLAVSALAVVNIMLYRLRKALIVARVDARITQ